MQHKFSLHILSAALLIAGLAPAIHAQNDRDMHDRARFVTDRAIGDLQRVMNEGNLTGDQSGRLDAAMRDLHQFRESVDNGNFDRDRLDHAMRDIDFVMNNGRLNDRQRNELREDLHRLQDLRDHSWHQ